MLTSVDRFIQERKWLHNVTPKTVSWHTQALRWLPSESPTIDNLKAVVLGMRERGLQATSCNCFIGSINAYLKWSGSALRIPKLKTESYIPGTYTRAQVRLIMRSKSSRLRTLLLLLFDTGVRLDEALSLRVSDVNMDDLLLTVTGKGRKQRVPFSIELRRTLARFIVGTLAQSYVFATKDGRKLGQRNVLRDTKALCRKLGFEPPRRTLHATRHTFATEYLRRGGSLFHLQKVLGHTSLEMVRRYANLVTTDLQAEHERVSLLSRA